MSYRDSDYEELIDRADQLMQKNQWHAAWECIAAIPDDIKFIEYVEDCAFFASVALNDRHFEEFLRYFHVSLTTVTKADKAFEEDLGDLFYTMSANYGTSVAKYVKRVIEMVTERFRTPGVLTICAAGCNMMNIQEEGLPLLDEALDKDPFYSKAWHEKVFAYHFMGDTEKEVESCNYYLALEPETNEYTILVPIANSYTAAERYDDAIDLLKRVLGCKHLQPEQMAGVHCLIAENYCYMGDKKNELMYRQKALDTFPEEVAYWSMLAQYYITTESRPMKAERIMREAMMKFSHDPVMHYMFAAVECQIAIDSGKPSKLEVAAEHIEKALKGIKHDSLFYLLAARIYLLKKDYQSGLKFARHAYRLDPNDKSAILYMVLGSFGCGKMTEFRKMYRIYAKINPTAKKDVLVIIPEAQGVIDRMK